MKAGAPRVWTLTQAALTALKTVLVASRALQGLEGVCEAVSEHRHLASTADTAREEAKAPAGRALVRMLHSLDGRREDKEDRICVSMTTPSAPLSFCTVGSYRTMSAYDGGAPAIIYPCNTQETHRSALEHSLHGLIDGISATSLVRKGWHMLS